MSDKCLPTRILLQVSLRHVLISLANSWVTKQTENIIEELPPN